MKLAYLSFLVLIGASPAPPPLNPPLDPAAQPAPETSEDIGIGRDERARMTVSTMIDGKGPYQFLIDTGAERTVISAELAQRLKLREGTGTRMHSMTGVGNVSTVIIPKLQVSKNPVSGIHAPALREAHLGAAGMLGIDSLQKQRVLFDFGQQKMTVTPSRVAERNVDSNTIVVTARTRLGRLVLVDARLDGQKLAVVLDTGSEVTIGNEALRQKLIGKKRMGVSIPIELVSVTGGKMQANYTRVRQVRIGGVLIRDLPVAFAEVHPFRQLGLTDEPALLLGMDALRLFDRVSVDFANRKVRFTHPDVSGLARDTRMATRAAACNLTRRNVIS